MSDFVFIKAGAALGVVVSASTAYAGDVERVDLSFAGVDYWSVDQGAIDPTSPNYNGQTVSSEAGRNFNSAGCSNMDTTVCWNTGADFENWASISFQNKEAWGPPGNKPWDHWHGLRASTGQYFFCFCRF